MTQSSTRSSRGTILTVTSGKGGVGKTNVVINLAVALARLGHRVGIVDADFGLGNIDVLLGVTPAFHLGQVLNGEQTLDAVMIDGPLGIKVIPAGSGIQSLTALDPKQWQRLRTIVRDVAANFDFLLVDTAAGVSTNVIELLLLAERVLIVTSYEPAAIVDAYAVIKILTQAAADKEIGLVVNAARDSDQAGLVFRQLDVAASRFLNRSLKYYGFIVEDPALREAVLGQRPVVDALPQAPASRCFRVLASRVAGFAPNGGAAALAAYRIATMGSANTGPLSGPMDPDVFAAVEASRCA
jgi:flagellar biosynthesis protein FlhG